MLKLIVAVTSLAIVAVHSAPQLNDVELKEQAFNRINEAEYDYKWATYRTVKTFILQRNPK